MVPTTKIDAYLKQVRAGLRRLSDAEVADIVNELRAHIVERTGAAGAANEVAVDSVLHSLGRPQQIAALYVAEGLASRAESSRSPWMILRSVFYWSTVSIKGFAVFLVCLIGYMFGLAFFLAALMKPFHPQGVGLWISNNPDSYSLHVGGFSGPPGDQRELLGWWMIPIGCSLGGGTILITTHFALWALRRLRTSRPLA
jgi:HAAS domain-containing protein